MNGFLQRITMPLLLLINGVLAAQADRKIAASVALPIIKTDTFNVINYSAKPDGITMNTKAINNAISDCSAKGGGVVLIPKGIWLTGPLVLQSHVNLHLQANALLLSTPDRTQYTLVKGSYEGLTQLRNQSPISATGATDIAITGQGIIDGNGQSWRMVQKDMTGSKEWGRLLASGGMLNASGNTWYPSASSLQGANTENPGFILPGRDSNFYKSVKDFMRPNMLVLTRCKRILLKDVTIQNSPNWNIHLLESTDITADNITVRNPVNGQNSDGMDLESCQRVIVQNSRFDVGDDGICIKSGRDKEGRAKGIPTREVVISNCVVFHAHGGVVIGSEMSGGVSDIYVNDCSFVGTDIGLRFKSRRGRGGVVENIFISNIWMTRILKEAISFDMFYPKPGATEAEIAAMEARMVPADESTPLFKNIFIEKVTCIGAARAIFIRGLPEKPLQRISITNSVFQTNKGISISQATDLHFSQLSLQCRDTDPLINVKNSKRIIFQQVHAPDAHRFLLSDSSATDIEVKKK